MQRRVLASMTSFYTEQQSVDVREGLERRVKEGWFVGHAPYGYRNVRIDGWSIVEIDPMNGPKVRRIYELFAYHHCTLDMIVERLAAEGIAYKAPNLDSPEAPSTPSCMIAPTSARFYTRPIGMSASTRRSWIVSRSIGSKPCWAAKSTGPMN
jgi:hypothetical protein